MSHAMLSTPLAEHALYALVVSSSSLMLIFSSATVSADAWPGPNRNPGAVEALSLA